MLAPGLVWMDTGLWLLGMNPSTSQIPRAQQIHWDLPLSQTGLSMALPSPPQTAHPSLLSGTSWARCFVLLFPQQIPPV